MTQNWPSKHPDQLQEYSWVLPLSDEETAEGSPQVSVLTGGLVVAGTASIADGKLSVSFVGGTQGAQSVVQITVPTNQGSVGETFIVPIERVMQPLSRAAALRDDIDALESALQDLALGKTVKETWRNGRRLIYAQTDATTIEKLIERKKLQLAELEGTSTGYRRRRPIIIGTRD